MRLIGTLQLTVDANVPILSRVGRMVRPEKAGGHCEVCMHDVPSRAHPGPRGYDLGKPRASATAATVGVNLATDGSVAQYLCSVSMWAGIGAACYFVNRLSAAIMNGGR